MEDSGNFRITDKEHQDIDKLRQLFNGNIPNDLDNDLNLLRWVHGWKGQMNEIEPRLKAYIETRKLLHLDGENFLETVDQCPLYDRCNSFFGFSTFRKAYPNSKDNMMFISERLENVNFNVIMAKALNCGDNMKSRFVGMESMLRHVLIQEKLTGRPSGITVVYDMYGFNFLEHANPNSAVFKVFKPCFAMMQDFYCDLLCKIYVINAPMLIGVIWELIKRFMAPATQNKVVILGSDYKDILRQHYDLDVLPVQYGGNRRDTSGEVDPNHCCNVPVMIPNDYKRESNDCNNFLTEYIKPNGVFHVRKSVDVNGAKLTWKFWVNSEVEFCVYKEISPNERIQLTPRFTLCTPKLAEDGEVTCDEPAEYILEFRNHSTMWFSLKLEYCAEVFQ